MSRQVRDYRYIDKGIHDRTLLEELKKLDVNELTVLKSDVEDIIGRDSFLAVVEFINFVASMYIFLEFWTHRKEPVGLSAILWVLFGFFLVSRWCKIRKSRNMSRFLVRRAIRMQPVIERSYLRFRTTLIA